MARWDVGPLRGRLLPVAPPVILVAAWLALGRALPKDPSGRAPPPLPSRSGGTVDLRPHLASERLDDVIRDDTSLREARLRISRGE